MKTKSRVNMRPRPTGWVFLIIFLPVQMAAFNSGENLFYLVAAVLFGFVAVSVIVGQLSLRGLKISRDLPESVHRGEDFLTLLRIENRKFMFPPGALRIFSTSGNEGSTAYVDKLPMRRAALVRLTDSFSRRGVQPAPPLILSSGFPFGLVNVGRSYADTTTVTVYPRIRNIKKAALDQLEGLGVIPRVNQGDGDEFFSLRDYIPGDDIRRIAWKVSARRRSLVVRELEPNTSRTIMIVFDTRIPQITPALDDDFEDAVDLAASLAIAFLARQYTVGVVTPSESIPLGLGNAHGTKIMELLADVRPVAGESFRAEDWFAEATANYAAANVFISPNPELWGRPTLLRGARFVNPQEFAHGQV